MQIHNTADKQVKPPIIMLLYGEGGVGKTTFTSTAPKPVLADCEGGSKYFGLRGISMDVATITKWSDMGEFLDVVKSDEYETIIIDPIGELMEKLMRYMIAKGDKKNVQSDGSPTMNGWGWLKKVMRDYLKVLRDSGKHVILVAHIDEKPDEERIIKRPMIMTKLSQEIVNMVDIVGLMTTVGHGDESKRVIMVDPASDKYVAKDRTGQLGKIIEPDFGKIVEACQGTKKFTWSKIPGMPEEKKEPTKPVDPPTPKAEENEEFDNINQDKPKPKTTDLAKSAKAKLTKLKKKTGKTKTFIENTPEDVVDEWTKPKPE